MAAQQFSVREWLKAVDESDYESEFLSNGYVSYDAIVKLSEDDLEAAGIPGRLANDVETLKALGSEEEAIRVLSVSELVYAWLIIVCL